MKIFNTLFDVTLIIVVSIFVTVMYHELRDQEFEVPSTVEYMIVCDKTDYYDRQTCRLAEIKNKTIDYSYQ